MKPYNTGKTPEIFESQGFSHTKSLGQNFLTDKKIRDTIIEAAEIESTDLIIEIGPGKGVLTNEAARRAAKVIGIEIDKSLIPILDFNLREHDNVKIVNENILKCDLGKTIADAGEFAAVKVLGNLPYYITTPIIMKILEENISAKSITVMMQKEVAERMEAEPGTKTYGALSLAVQYYCTVKHIANVPKEAFVPRPKVDSRVLRLDIRSRKPVEVQDEKYFFACIRAGFGQRRKTLRNSLAGVTGNDKEKSGRILELTGTDPLRRAETLTMQEFADIANKLFEEQNKR